MTKTEEELAKFKKLLKIALNALMKVDGDGVCCFSPESGMHKQDCIVVRAIRIMPLL